MTDLSLVPLEELVSAIRSRTVASVIVLHVDAPDDSQHSESIAMHGTRIERAGLIWTAQVAIDDEIRANLTRLEP